ncbi:MAG: hypothetical protein EXS47_01405 [Candidatus Zambryskibacteria bacterium]|nr:hypothetical protein [Candidatus Zambryskibacteria bacterium]
MFGQEKFMTAEEVDIDRMCKEAAGYFTPERVMEAFAPSRYNQPDGYADARAWVQFRGKTLPEVLNSYGHTTYQFGGVHEKAAIRFIARFFPRMFLS